MKTPWRRRGGTFLRPSVRTLGYIAEDGHILAAVSYTGNECISPNLLYRHPDAPLGLGKLALKAALAIALDNEECERMTFTVRTRNERSVKYYRLLGLSALEQGETTLMCLRSKEAIATAIDRIDNQL